jgi:hypothetical protein
VRLTTHLNIELRLRMFGTILPYDIVAWSLDTYKNSFASCLKVPLKPINQTQFYLLNDILHGHMFRFQRNYHQEMNTKYRIIQNDCRGFNNLSYKIHLR